jgi:7-keto-8-aminopelargonate synthetase-like enzyme
MDGDRCPLPELLDLKARHNAYLMLDESHALGVLGEHGRGTCEYYGIDPGDIDIFTASLSKAIPSNGGYIAGCKALIYYLQHGASPFIFSAATSPAAIGAASAALSVIGSENDRRKRLWKNTRILIYGFRHSGWTVMSDQSPIIPIFVGPEVDAYRLTRALFDHGVAALAVVYPAVSKNSARLRICATAAMDGQMIEDVLRVFSEIRPQFHS